MKTTDPAQEAMLKAFRQQRQAMSTAFSKQEDELAAGHRDRQKRVATFVDSLAKASDTTRARLQSDWDQEVARLRQQAGRSQDSRRDRASQDANAHDAFALRTLRACQEFANEFNKERNTAYDRALEELYALCNRTLGDSSSHSAKLSRLNGGSSRPSVLLNDLLKTIRVELELPDPPRKSRDAAGNDPRVPGTQDSVTRALNHPVDTGALPDPDPTQRGDPTTTQPLDAPASFLEELDTKFASDQQFREAYHASAEEQFSNALTRWNNEVANTRGRLDSLFDSFTHSVVTPPSQSSSKSSARWDSFYSAEQRRNQEVLAVFRRAVADTEGTIHRAVSSVRLLEFRAANMNISTVTQKAEPRNPSPVSHGFVCTGTSRPGTTVATLVQHGPNASPFQHVEPSYGYGPGILMVPREASRHGSPLTYQQPETRASSVEPFLPGIIPPPPTGYHPYPSNNPRYPTGVTIIDPPILPPGLIPPSPRLYPEMMGSPLSFHAASPELSLEFTLAQTKRQQDFDASQNERRLTSTAEEARRAHDFALALVRWKVETDADELARKAKFAEASSAARDAWAQHEETLERDFQLGQEMMSTAFYAANEARQKAFVAALRNINDQVYDQVYSVLDEVMFAFLAYLHD